MDSSVRLYHFGDYKQGYDEIERKNVLSQVTCNQLFKDHIDYFFGDYCEQAMKQDSKDIHTSGSFLHDVFSKHSFADFLIKIAKKDIDTVVSGNWNTPLTSQQLQDFISALQQQINVYAEKHNISNESLNEQGISYDTPYGYAFLQMLEKNGISIPANTAEIYNATKLGYMFENFFASYLANIFFKRTAESLKKDKEISEVIELGGKVDKYMKLVLSLFNGMSDEKEKNRFAEGVYNILKSKSMAVKDGEKFVAIFEDLMEAYKDEDDIIPADLQSHAKAIFIHNFSQYLPAEGAEPTVYLKSIAGGDYVFVVLDNFYFDTPPSNKIQSERPLLKNIFGTQGSMIDRDKITQLIIKDACIFNAAGQQVRWGDFDPTKEEDYLALQNTYYILNQQDGFFNTPDNAINEQKILEDNDVLKAIFGMDENYKDFLQPILVDPEYVRYKAIYKIEKGVLVMNKFA